MPFVDKSTLTYPATNAFPVRKYTDNKAPTSSDYKSFQLFDIWIDTSSSDAYIMVDRTASFGTWVRIGGTGGPAETLEGNTGGPVSPDGTNNINIIGTAPLTVTGNPGTNTLTITSEGSLADEFVTDGGTAIPAAGILNVVGGVGATTSGAGNTITINTSSPQFAWNEVLVAGPTAMSAHNGYVANTTSPTLCQLTLPAVAAFGDTIEISGEGTGGWQLLQNAGQTVHFVSQDTTTGAGGSISSTQDRDAIRLLCVTANTDWNVLSAAGNLTIV